MDNCTKCDIWEEFVEEINSELKPEKRIEVIDCTNFHDYGITDDLRILKFMPFIKGTHDYGVYPILFFEGRRKDFINSRTEAESWLRARVHEDFLLPVYNPDMFSKECQFGEKGVFKKKIICESL